MQPPWRHHVRRKALTPPITLAFQFKQFQTKSVSENTKLLKCQLDLYDSEPRMAEIKRIWIEWTSNNFVDASYFFFSFVFHLGKGLFARPGEERSLWWWKYYISHWGQGEGDLIKPLGSDNLSLLATLFYYVLDWRTFGSRISNSHTDKVLKCLERWGGMLFLSLVSDKSFQYPIYWNKLCIYIEEGRRRILWVILGAASRFSQFFFLFYTKYIHIWIKLMQIWEIVFPFFHEPLFYSLQCSGSWLWWWAA